MFWNRKRPNPEKTKMHVTIGDREIEQGDPFNIISPLWWTVSIYDGIKKYNSDLKPFSLPQRYIFAIQWYISEVNNGGHDQFYFNSTGIVWQDALKGFAEIDHKQAWSILKASVDRLNGSPSLDRFERQNQLEQGKAGFEDLDRKFYNIADLDKVMMSYIRTHKTDFFFDGFVNKPNIL